MKKQNYIPIYDENSLPFDIFDTDGSSIDHLSHLSWINLFQYNINTTQNNFSKEDILIIAKSHFDFVFLTLLRYFRSSIDILSLYNRNNAERFYDKIVSLCVDICEEFEIKTISLEDFNKKSKAK